MLRICGYNFDICRLKAAVLQRRETEASFCFYNIHLEATTFVGECWPCGLWQHTHTHTHSSHTQLSEYNIMQLFKTVDSQCSQLPLIQHICIFYPSVFVDVCTV